MLSNFVTAAKGLFKRPESEDALTDPAGDSVATTSEMATTRADIVPQDTSRDAKTKVTKRGKRKAQPVSTEEPIDKRRKRNSLEAAEASDNESTVKSPNPVNAIDDEKQDSTDSAPKKHFRFGSEEPAVPEELQPQESNEAPNDEDSDSDDDAPETINNSAQLIQMKEQAKKQEKLKQQYVYPLPPPTLPPFIHGLLQFHTEKMT